MTIDPFNFDDTSDLPEDLAKRLSTTAGGRNPGIEKVLKVLRAAKDNSVGALSLVQIKVAGQRMGITFPTDATMQAWLKAAVKTGEIAKPTRQSYVLGDAAADPVDTEEVSSEEATEEALSSAEVDEVAKAAEEPETDPDDPLAALGLE